MRIVGEWLSGDDGVVRPIIRIHVSGVEGRLLPERFLVDSGADRTVLSGELLRDLRLPSDRPPPMSALMGIGGATAYVVVRTTLGFTRDDGGTVTVRGEFAAFTDPRAIDISILGRDVLDNFDLILSRRHDEVLLLAPNHHYRVTRL